VRTRIPVVLAFMIAAARVPAQAIGSLPEKSPFVDLRDEHRMGVMAGYFSTSRDPAGVGPKSGPMLGLRYDLHGGGPVYVYGRLFGVPTERDILDYTKKQAFRRVGTQASTIVGADLGLAVAVTGERSWHRWQPILQFGAGFASGVGDKPDVSGYSFGTRFDFSWGLGARYATGKRSELRADVIWTRWQNKYPESYRSTEGDSVAIRPSGSLSPWTTNRAITVGWTWSVFR